MKLFFKPGACSMATHIAINEIGAGYSLEKVDTSTKETETGADFLEINPDGYVPALQLASGDILTEGPAILQYVADQKPESNLAPANGTLERTRLQQHLNYVGTELHKSFGIFFSGKELSSEERDAAVQNVGKKFSHFEKILSDGRNFLQGENFSVADAYLFVVTNWANFTGIDLASWPKLGAFQGRVASRPAVQATLKAEGLID